jgi:fluoride ion exporter CrcB/FEX
LDFNKLTKFPESVFRSAAKLEILDKILFLGFALTGLGFIGFLVSFSVWNKSGYGELQPDQFMKLLLPAVTSVIVGIQVMFSALLFETLRATKS